MPGHDQDSAMPIDEKFDAVHDELARVRASAEEDEKFQHGLSFRQAIKIYKTAVFWSVTASMCIIMEGYDTLLLGSMYALPSFRQRFGFFLDKKHGYQIPAPWQAGCSQAANVGSIIGCFLGGIFVDRFGYRKTMCGALLFITPFIGLVTFAPNLIAIVCGEILCGISWGIFSTLCEAYASEICPLSLRGYLTTHVNLCWGIGHFIGAGVLVKGQKIQGVWGYRLPFILQWIWPAPLFILLAFAPESPWWLVRKGKIDLAEKSVRRLARNEEKDRAKDTVALMILTNKHEIDHSTGSTYADLFKGSDTRRTEISAMAWMMQALSGASFAGNSTYFFEQAGMATGKAFTMTMINYGLACCGTILSWFLIGAAGRRTIFTTGLCVLSTLMLLIGVLSVVAENGKIHGALWGQAAMMIVWTFSYYCTIGPMTYCIVGETSSTRCRNKTIALSRILYNCLGICFGVMTPYMLHPDKWNWRGRTGFFWAPICFCGAVWAYFRLPEMKNRSYFELDVLFTNNIPARKFKGTKVDINGEIIREDEA